METVNLNKTKIVKEEIIRLMMTYRFALNEVNTKIDILRQEFQYIHEYNPIEHVNSRVKSPKSILNKVNRKNLESSLPSIKDNIRDIAGVRITCSFISDIYKVSDMLQKQKDITVISVKDYIKNPKPNGYRSLHLIIQIPIFMSDRVEHVFVEIQIRTIAMDFWASLEHKIFYKHNHNIPQYLKDELKEAAISSAQLDIKMENINKKIVQLNKEAGKSEDKQGLVINNNHFFLPQAFFTSEPLSKNIKNEEG